MAEQPERMARFEREAKLLAALDHPHIAAIHGLHEEAGQHFLVMELVEGEDLSARIKRGPIPIDEALEMARQLAEALEAAHGRGIVHRDLKPANIRLAADGKVKVLDFGLAKALVPDEPPGTDASLSATTTADGTVIGAVMGTPGYMSPEQARGDKVDERSDIWSFGCVLWVCLTRQKLFPGVTAQNVRRLLRRCLAKDPRDRLHHIADARIELENPDPAPPAAGGSTRGYKSAVAVLAVGLIAALLYSSRTPAYRSDSRGDNPLAGARFSKVTDFEGSELGAAISPDGRFVAFVSDRDGPLDVFVTQIGTGVFRNLTQGRDKFALGAARSSGNSIGFTGDGSEIWFGAGPALLRMRAVPLLGGPVRNFLGEDVINVDWSPDDERLVYQEGTQKGDPIYVADRNGTNSRLILGSTAGTHQHYPIWSIDGQWIYLARGRPTTLEMDLWRVRADGEGLEQLTRRKLDVRYPTPIDERTVLYSARDADGAGPWLWAVDVETRVSRRASVGLEQYSSVTASADRRRLVATVQNPRAELWSVPILDRPATESDAEPFADLPTARALAPRFGGSSLFYLSSQGSGDGLWRYGDGNFAEIWRGSETALLEPAAVSPNGDSVVVLLRRDDRSRLHVLSADGAQLRVLSDNVDARGAAAWSPDGRWIVTGGSEAGVPGLFKIPVDGGVPERIADGEPLNPVWSPDGNLIVYAGAQVTLISPMLAVRPDGEKVELPEIDVLRSGERMRFLPDASGLVYMKGLDPSRQDFWLLDLTTMKSRQLTRLDPSATMRTFDITPDGQRIVFDRLSDDSDIVMIELGDPARMLREVPQDE